MKRLSTHYRLSGFGQHSIHPWHYPSRTDQLKAFDLQSVRKKARDVGPQTEQAISELISIERPLRMLRRAQGILRLSKKYPKEALEYGCEMGMKFNKMNVRYIEQCALHFQRSGRPGPASSVPRRKREHIYLHSD
jgi:hypothetical protein